MAISQNKPHVYFDDYNNEVTKSSYYEKGVARFYVLNKRENDSVVEHFMIPRTMLGFLNRKELDQLQDVIANVISKNLNKENIIILNFFKEGNNEIKHYSRDKSFIKKCSKQKNVSQFFITEQGYRFKSNKTPVFEDKNNTIKKLLFSNEHFSCGYVIIKPEGYYYLFLGEYQQSKILDFAIKTWVY